MAGRRRSLERREPFVFGQRILFVEVECVEDTLLGILESFKRQTKSDLVLIGFDLTRELRAIANDYPLLPPHFASWVDLQDLVYHSTDVKMASMCDSLTALKVHDGVKARYYESHSAGNDAVRNLALLVGLMSLPRPYKFRLIQCSTRNPDPWGAMRCGKSSESRKMEIFGMVSGLDRGNAFHSRRW